MTVAPCDDISGTYSKPTSKSIQQAYLLKYIDAQIVDIAIALLRADQSRRSKASYVIKLAEYVRYISGMIFINCQDTEQKIPKEPWV